MPGAFRRARDLMPPEGQRQQGQQPGQGLNIEKSGATPVKEWLRISQNSGRRLDGALNRDSDVLGNQVSQQLIYLRRLRHIRIAVITDIAFIAQG